MGIRIKSFGGPLVWLLRKNWSGLTSKIMLSVVSKKYDKSIQRYIKYFNEQKEPPLFHNVMVETINRCNGECSFCPANKNSESRPFKKMSEELFYGIIGQLKSIKWNGKLFLCINNEPFIDNRILSFARYAKKELGCCIVLISNGTLIDTSKMDEMSGLIDQLIINDYSSKYRLSEGHRAIYDYCRGNIQKFAQMDIVINRRYAREILATRAGSAPNKPIKNNKVNTPCIYPFTDFVIFPDGEVGLCCNDCREETKFGNIKENEITDIWKNDKFKNVRLAMVNGRTAYPFCVNCDVVDAGEREKTIRELLSHV